MKKIIVFAMLAVLLAIMIPMPVQAEEIEVYALRTEYSKTYDLGGGRYRTVISSVPRHYHDEYGNWLTISTNIYSLGTEGYTAKFSMLPYVVRIKEDSARRIYPDRNDLSYWVDIGKPFENMGKPTKSGGYWVWDYPNAAIKIRIAAKEVKLHFILKNKNAPTSITFPFSAVGLTREGNKLYHNGEIVAILHKPIAFGSNLDEVGFPVQKACDIKFESGTLTISLDTTGLEYPIDIDPTLELQPSGKDTFIMVDAPTTNFGTATDLCIRDKNAMTRRTLLEFDISSVPVNSTIDSADMELYYYADAVGDPFGLTVWAYNLTRTDWVEDEATWNIYKTGSDWTTGGGDYSTSRGATTTVPADFGWMTWAVDDTVKYAYNNSEPAEFLVRFDDEGSTIDHLAVFYSNNYLGDTDLCPKLTIDYTAYTSPLISAIAASQVASTTARLNSVVDDDGNCDVTVRFGWGTSSETALDDYANNVTVAGTYNTGQYPYYDVSGLLNDTLYYFRADGTNSYGSNLTQELQFTTGAVLDEPANFVGYPDAEEISLSWVKGEGSSQTLVRYGANSYPATVTAGTLVYLGTSSSYAHTNLTAGTTYYYSAWGESGGSYSASYATLMLTTAASSGEGDELTVPDMPSRWMAAPNYTNLANMPIAYDAVNSVADSLSMPRGSLWMILALVLSMAAGLVVYLKAGHSVLAGGMVVEIGLIFGWVVQIVPFFIPVIVVILILGYVIAHREVQY